MTRPWPLPPPRLADRADLPGEPSAGKVKVLHVITRFTAGAGGNTLLSALGMDRDRYDVWVAGCPGGELWTRAEGGGVQTVQLRGFREVLSPLADLGVLLRLVRLMRRERFTVVHTHSTKGGVLGRVAAWVCRVPIVVHTFHGLSVHDGMSPLRRRLYLGLERRVVRFTDAFLAVAPRLAREAIELRLAPPGSVAVVPSAVELERIPMARSAGARRELGLPASGLVVGTVGRIDVQKAPLDFVRMAARLAGRGGGVRFVVVGDGPLKSAAEEEAQRLGAPVQFAGHRDNALELSTAFDVFVITSTYEGLGRALTEAMAAGVPVVATAVNGVPDLVVHGSTGLLARPGDCDSLVACVTWLLDHPELARGMARQGQELVRRTFSPAQMCADLDSTYSALLGLPPAAADAAVVARPPAQRAVAHA